MNDPKYISKKELINCLSLLDQKYHNLGLKIIFYKNSSHLLLSSLINKENKFIFYLKTVILGSIYASYRISDNTIRIYGYKRKAIYEDNYLKLRLLFDILHEIRHAYQRYYAPQKFKKDITHYLSSEQKGYSKQWVEKDANRFAKVMLYVYKQQIANILNIEKVNWEFLYNIDLKYL